MLKIKSDKMGELEKFGFSTYVFSDYYDRGIDNKIMISVGKITGIIYRTNVMTCSKPLKSKKHIQDLIKADLIEEV